jgi:hypothetical protein
MTPAALHALMDVDAWVRSQHGDGAPSKPPVSTNPAADMAALMSL